MKDATIASIAFSSLALALNAISDWWAPSRWIALFCAGAAVALAWHGLVQP